MAITALEIWRPRFGGLCWYGSTGIGWLGPHHCFWCYVYTMQADYET
jgi:hypothetical protein